MRAQLQSDPPRHAGPPPCLICSLEPAWHADVFRLSGKQEYPAAGLAFAKATVHGRSPNGVARPGANDSPAWRKESAPVGAEKRAIAAAIAAAYSS